MKFSCESAKFPMLFSLVLSFWDRYFSSSYFYYVPCCCCASIWNQQSNHTTYTSYSSAAYTTIHINSVNQDHLISKKLGPVVWNLMCCATFYFHLFTLRLSILWHPSNHINTIHIHFNCIALSCFVMGIVYTFRRFFAKAPCVMWPHIPNCLIWF